MLTLEGDLFDLAKASIKQHQISPLAVYGALSKKNLLCRYSFPSFTFCFCLAPIPIFLSFLYYFVSFLSSRRFLENMLNKSVTSFKARLKFCSEVRAFCNATKTFDVKKWYCIYWNPIHIRIPEFLKYIFTYFPLKFSTYQSRCKYFLIKSLSYTKYTSCSPTLIKACGTRRPSSDWAKS